MFSASDYDKLQQIMAESPEKKELLTRLLESHQMSLSTISHEIRNPLTLVYSTLQFIESQHPEVLEFKHWSDMRRDIEYMKLLLEELSSYNNSEKLSLSSLDTNTFFKTLALSFAASVVEDELQFTSHILPQLPVIKADAVKLRQLLLNLLTNARDAVDRNSPLSTVTLDVYTEANTLIVSVKDNGCGIDPEKLAHIFEPFVTYKKQGSGLGLAIANRIARAHGGTLCATSTPGVSTVFTLTLPIQ